MKRSEQQLTLPGIEVANLELWKATNGIFSGEIAGLAWNTGRHSWAAWAEFESPVIFICQNTPGDMGYGFSEQRAIANYCEKSGIKKPIWWG